MNVDRRAGFSLLEVILAVAITVMALGMVYSLLIPTLDATARAEQATGGAAIGQGIAAIMARDLATMYNPREVYAALVPAESPPGAAGDVPRPPSQPAGGPEGEFEWGEDLADFPDGFKFHSLRDAGGSQASVITYAIQGVDDDLGVLFRRVEPYGLVWKDAAASGAEGPRFQEVFDRVVSVKFNYLGGGVAGRGRGEGDWEKACRVPPIPRAVRVEVRILLCAPSEVPPDADRDGFIGTFTTVVAIPNA